MSEQTRPWPTLSVWQRWGPVSLVAVLLLGVGVVASTHRNPAPSRPTTADRSTLVSRLAGDPALPVTYAEAVAAGTAQQQSWGNCDPDIGRIRYPTIYAPPCVPAADGDNGGATSQGVTADTIKVVYYQPPPNDISASVQGLLDPSEVVIASVKKYVELFEGVFETYGRHVEIIPLQGSGVGTDDTAARADAVKVASEIKAFASIGGPGQTNAYADELAARHVLCLGCGLSVPDSTFQKDAPYMWGTLATPEQFLQNLGDLIQKDLVGKPARYAGDPTMRDRTRVFGVVHFEQDPPVYKGVEAGVEERNEGTGYKPKLQETYLLDLAKLPERATTIVAHLKDAGITTVIFLGDPIMPIYLTKAATAQNYFPEWVVTGTVLTDTTTIGRLYDQEQWAHAFGQSSLALRTPRDLSDPYRLYRWYFGENPAAYKTAATFYPTLQQLFTGLHLAGPDLTPEHFAGGLFRYPPSGGSPTAPHISYGDHGYFGFADGADFIGVDDSTLIWWDAEQRGPDEQGEDGIGMWRYVDGGARYLPGKVRAGPIPFFEREGSATVVDKLPAEVKTPDYDPPANAPAAQKGGN